VDEVEDLRLDRPLRAVHPQEVPRDVELAAAEPVDHAQGSRPGPPQPTPWARRDKSRASQGYRKAAFKRRGGGAGMLGGRHGGRLMTLQLPIAPPLRPGAPPQPAPAAPPPAASLPLRLRRADGGLDLEPALARARRMRAGAQRRALTRLWPFW
jgi:hypothetical protein